MRLSRAGMKSKSSIIRHHWEMLMTKFEREISTMEYLKRPYTIKELKDQFSTTCWACEFGPVTTYRCHIKPLNEGGSNDSDNIHLLCEVCHRESEFLSGEAYIEWFRTRWDYPSPLFDSLMQRALKTQKDYLDGNWHFIHPRQLELIHKNEMIQSYLKEYGIIIKPKLEGAKA
jgi:hypothetical protein